MKLTNGDIAINKTIALEDNVQKVAKVDLETLEKNKEIFKSQVETGETTAKDIKEIIIADVDKGNVKYTFDSIYKDEELISVEKIIIQKEKENLIMIRKQLINLLVIELGNKLTHFL